MKKVVLLFLLSFIFRNSNGQQYYPFPTSNAFWLDGMSTGPNDDPGWCANFQHTITGDTVINSIAYHKLDKSVVYHFYPFIGMCVFDSTIASSPNSYQGAFREDSSLKKVYYIPANDSNEVLMYDFDLNVGDTMFTALTVGCWGFPVTSIDSVLVGSLYHKRYNTSSGFTSFIEGVGSTDGLFAAWCDFTEFSQSLICLNINNVGAFPSGSSCSPLLGIEKPGENNVLVQVSPNPSPGLIHLTFQNLSALKNIQIMNSIGKTLAEKNTRNSETDFDLSSYPKGVYFFKINCADKIFFQKMILI
jgi:hypothetical protein